MEAEYEYPSPTELEGDATIYFMVPQSLAETILWSDNVNRHLLPVFAYFSVKRGLDNTVTFSVNQIVNWLNRQPNRNKTGINNKVLECIRFLHAKGYLTLTSPVKNAAINEITFNADKVREECNGHSFIILYLDEIKKILGYQKPGKDNYHLGNEIVLLVFLYLKYGTFKRPNKLMLQEMSNNVEKDLERRRKNSPEAFDEYYYKIAEKLGLSSRAVSAATKILHELGLVYFEELPHYKHGDEWRTDHTIFAFMYKRERGKLIASGRAYYEREIENKKLKLARYRKRVKTA